MLADMVCAYICAAGFTTLPAERPEGDVYSEKTLRDLHMLLLEVRLPGVWVGGGGGDGGRRDGVSEGREIGRGARHGTDVRVMEGKPVCGNCGHEYNTRGS